MKKTDHTPQPLGPSPAQQRFSFPSIRPVMPQRWRLSLGPLLFALLLPAMAFSQGAIDCGVVLAQNGFVEFGRPSKTVGDRTYLTQEVAFFNQVPSYPVVNGEPLSEDGTSEVYIAIIDHTNCEQILGTYYGGSGDDQPLDIAIDAAGNLLITGRTSSTDLPTTDGTSISANGRGIFTLRYDASGNLVYATVVPTGINPDSRITTDGTTTYVTVEDPVNETAVLYGYDAAGTQLFSTTILNEIISGAALDLTGGPDGVFISIRADDQNFAFPITNGSTPLNGLISLHK